MAQAAADALKEQGNKAFKEGDYAAAEELYTQACQRFSRNPLLFTNRANARLKLQRWEGAVNDCLKSIEISGRAQNHKAYYFLGEFFFFGFWGFLVCGRVCWVGAVREGEFLGERQLSLTLSMGLGRVTVVC
jgi:tetratricopeptide (TPR) repeat protein